MRKKQVTLLVGLPGSGKSTYVKTHFSVCGTAVLSRDQRKRTIRDLVVPYRKLLGDKTVHHVVIDNTHLTREHRAFFLRPAYELGIPVVAILFTSPQHDCETRLLRKAYVPGTKFTLPVDRLTDMSRTFEVPDPVTEVGLVDVRRVDVPPPTWPLELYPNKVLFLDVDGTLRDVSHLPKKFPCKVSEVKLLRPAHCMASVLRKFSSKGYILVALSNQSGVSRGVVSTSQVEKCFERVLKLLGSTVHIHLLYCPHSARPESCYCRKPHTGMIVQASETWRANPAKSLLVGDQQSDRELARRVGCKFFEAKVFWQMAKCKQT